MALSPVLSRSSAIRHSRSARDCPKTRREEFNVLADAEVGIEIFPEPLRHVGDAGTDRGAVRRIGDIAAKHVTPARLHLPGAGDNAEQRRLADAVGADQSDHAAGRQRYRDIIERDDVGHSVG